MSATRTQVYFTESQRRRIDERAKANGVTMAEVVRQAIDAYLAEDRPDPGAALGATFGADTDAGVPSRDEWARA